MKLVSRYAFAILITSVVGLLFTVDGVSAQNITTCADFSYQEDAQKFYDQGGGRPQDWYGGMDADGDGIACENLPGKPIHKQGWFWPVVGVAGVGIVGGGGYAWNRRSMAGSVIPAVSIGESTGGASGALVAETSTGSKVEETRQPEATSVSTPIINVNVDNRSEAHSRSASHANAGSPDGFWMTPESARAMPYSKYLETSYWKTVRRNNILRAGGRCADCGRGENEQVLEVHHLSYEYLGREKDQYLRVLCSDCHKRRHDIPSHPTDLNLK